MTSINIQYNGTSSFIPAAPIQKTFIQDTTNPQFPRYAYLTQDSITVAFSTASVVIPMSQIYQAAVTASPSLTWPPIIITQPNPSQFVTHPTSVFFGVSASAELPISYQWYYQSGSGNFTTIASSVSSSNYAGATTNALTCSTTNANYQNTASYVCVLSDAAGQTTSSIAILNVN